MSDSDEHEEMSSDDHAEPGMALATLAWDHPNYLSIAILRTPGRSSSHHSSSPGEGVSQGRQIHQQYEYPQTSIPKTNIPKTRKRKRTRIHMTNIHETGMKRTSEERTSTKRMSMNKTSMNRHILDKGCPNTSRHRFNQFRSKPPHQLLQTTCLSLTYHQIHQPCLETPDRGPLLTLACGLLVGTILIFISSERFFYETPLPLRPADPGSSGGSAENNSPHYQPNVSHHPLSSAQGSH